MLFIKSKKKRLSKEAYQKIFPVHLSKQQEIAFVMSPRLGDSLLSMIVVNNLVRQGYSVTVFGDHILALKNWFPWVKILPRPKAEEAKMMLMNYNLLLYAFTADVIADTEKWHPYVRILEQSVYNWQEKPMVDIQADFCRYDFLLQNVTRENNIVVPPHLTKNKYKKRIVIHPSSREIFRNWLPQRFLQLANSLKSQGYQPEFVVAASERKDWLWLIEQGHSVLDFSSLDEVAAWIYESGFFIGNDSGIGHLASNLGITTITLGIRKKLLQRWRPAWAPGLVLLPPKWLFARPLKQKFWKYFITVRQVLTAFDQLQQMSK